MCEINSCSPLTLLGFVNEKIILPQINPCKIFVKRSILYCGRILIYLREQDYWMDYLTLK